MALLELSDMIGAIEAYAIKQGRALDDLIVMMRAFRDGSRPSREAENNPMRGGVIMPTSPILVGEKSSMLPVYETTINILRGYTREVGVRINRDAELRDLGILNHGSYLRLVQVICNSLKVIPPERDLLPQWVDTIRLGTLVDALNRILNGPGETQTRAHLDGRDEE